MTDTAYESALAIVGMAGRFPGAAGVDELWRNLQAGVSGLRTITDDELAAAGATAAARDPHYVRVGGPVANVDQFDAGAFGFSPREAETMEPQHRLFLECSWEALESAGYSPVDPGVEVGVFGGCAFPDYMINNVSHMLTEPGGGLLFAVGNERDSLTSLVSYKLGLTGPSVTVQTFCSTSLVAVHLACQSLLTYECEMALAGGAFLPLPQPTGYRYEEGGITSPDGRVRSFDASANGSVMGSGVGVVALKRMTDAIAEGDVIHAVILGSAMNNDGRDKVGYTAPGIDGQAAVVQNALAVAGVKPETIGYVECHATGTQLGDSIELAAMSRVFDTVPATPCVLSSVKPSIGHLDRAAGVTGLMRAVLNLEHELLPGTVGYTAPNPALSTAADRFRVLAENQPWPAGPEPRRAGVSSFGLGGSNAHVVLEQAPARANRPASPGPQLLTLSANDPIALDAVTRRLREHLIEHPELELADVAYTTQVSRGRFALRRAVVCADIDDAVTALADPSRWLDAQPQRRDPPLSLDVAALGAAESDRLGSWLRGLGVRLTDSAAGSPAAQLGTADTADGPLRPLSLLAQAWLEGAVPDWILLHGDSPRRVQLPTYPFQRSRYWVEPRLTAPAPPPEGKVADPAQWTYLPTWTQLPLPTTDLDARLRAAGPWLVLADDARAEAMLAKLADAGAEVVAVRPGDALEQQDSGDFTVRPSEPDDLVELMGSLLVAPRMVVHGFSMAAAVGVHHDSAAHFDSEQERGFHSVLALVRALAEDPDGAAADLVLLTAGTVGVVGPDLSHPEHSSLAGIAPTLAQENPQLSCRHIDLGADGGPGTDIAQALAAMVSPHQGPVAVRSGEAWLRAYTPLALDTPDSQHPLVSARDTVLITGGLGNVGLVLARHLARSYGCRLVLTSRTELPARELWPDLADGTDRLGRHLRNILELEAEGASVLALSADVGDADQLRAVVAAAVAEFGGIDVVVHGAGVQDQAFFDVAHLASRASCDAHFRAKVHGFLVLQNVLADVLGDRQPNRRITLSSISTVLGGITLGPYAAANAALDGYARHARVQGKGGWITVDWDTWGIGELGYDGQATMELVMTPAEGVDVFERALAGADRIAQTVISTGAIAARLATWVTGAKAVDGSGGDLRARHPRPALSTPFVEPEAGLEAQVAGIWAETLALESVGAEDNFFELGGHSLIAIQLSTKLRSATATALPVTALVEHPTVRQLSRLILSGRSEAGCRAQSA